MKTSKLHWIVSLSLFMTSATVYSAEPNLSNYYQVVRGVMSKFDRDYNDLNDVGEPSPGALATVETFLTVLNQLGINKPGEYHFYSAENAIDPTCNEAGPNCSEYKVLVRNSIHVGDSTLFDAPFVFEWDIIVWSNNGDGFSKFFEGNYSPVAGTPGIANITLISCGGCSTVGHMQIEWDATDPIYHLRSKMYDTRLSQSPEIYGGVIIDARYSPTSGDMKLAIAAKSVCSSSGIGDSICDSGVGPNSNDHGAGYSALLHANSISGNVYLTGIQGANTSLASPDAQDAMCILADKSQDVSGVACQADAIDSFAGITAFTPNDAPEAWLTLGEVWPMAEITDSPTF